MSLFTGKTLMITGGTGFFGNAVLNRFLQTDMGKIRGTLGTGTTRTRGQAPMWST